MIGALWRLSKLAFFASAAALVASLLGIFWCSPAGARLATRIALTAAVTGFTALVLVAALKDGMEAERRSRLNGGVDPGEYRGQ